MLSFKDCQSIGQELKQLKSRPAPQFDATQLTVDNIADTLKQWRKTWLLQHSVVRKIGDVPTQIYMQAPAMDKTQLWMRGVDALRACQMIYQLNGWDERALLPLISQYKMCLDNTASQDEMIKQVRLLHANLAVMISQNQKGCKAEKAMHQLGFMRDFLWSRDFAHDFATLQKQGDQYLLHHAKSLQFDTANSKVWQNIERQDWYQELQDRLGHPEWFKLFIAQHLKTWAKQSPTPMSRSTPNPANAWHVADYSISEQQSIMLGQGSSAAISEPVDLKQSDTRETIHRINNRQLVNAALNHGVQQWQATWGPLFHPDERYSIAVVHQTLVGDEVTFSPDQQKSTDGSVIERKTRANNILRGEVRRVSEELPYSIKLYDSNHCINFWGNRRGRVRDVDVNTPREYIQHVCCLFGRAVSSNKQDNDDLQYIIRYLNGADHGVFDSVKYRPAAVDQALQRLSARLMENTDNQWPYPPQTRSQLALGLQAAVELKSLVHETWAGTLRRRLSNFSRDHFRESTTDHLIDWGARLAMFVVSGTKWLNPWHWRAVKHNHGHRKAMDTAVYEALLVESTGILMGGCMSAVDRKGELMEQVSAHRRHFAAHGTIYSLKHNRADYDYFLKIYANSTNKHIHALHATGTSGTKDHELTGRISWRHRLFMPFPSFRAPTVAGQEDEAMYSDSARAAKLRDVKVKTFPRATSTPQLFP